MKKIIIIILMAGVLLLAACQPIPQEASGLPRVMAVESFLVDIAQQVAGERLQVEGLMPVGADPHTYEPIPADLVRLSETQVVILNGAGFETWFEPLLANAPGTRLVIEASAGLIPREADGQAGENQDDDHLLADPHFWLDPVLVVRYVENIRDGLTAADPEGAEIYAQNAAAYILKLQELDAWVTEQMATVPPERRLMITNHESFGYYADRYGLRVVGAILPSVSTNAAPSSQQIIQLMEAIEATGAPAIFLEISASPEMARQIAEQTGVQVVTGLYTHSLSGLDGPVQSYLDLVRYNTTLIVEALR